MPFGKDNLICWFVGKYLPYTKDIIIDGIRFNIENKDITKLNSEDMVEKWRGKYCQMSFS